MKAILRSAIIVLAITAAASGATVAYFSDTETSANNTFTAGTLDLSVDALNPLVHATFAVTNMMPGEQKSGTYRLKNEGSLDGYIDIESITVTNTENGCNEPEATSGDTSCANPGVGEGELQDNVTATLFTDTNCDGSINGAEVAFYHGLVKDLPTNFALNAAIVSGTTQCIGTIFDWNSSANDNLAQGDGFTFALTFELGQTAAQ